MAKTNTVKELESTNLSTMQVKQPPKQDVSYKRMLQQFVAGGGAG